MDDISIILFSSECSGGYLWIIHLRSATMVQWVVGFHPRQYLVCPLWIKRNRNMFFVRRETYTNLQRDTLKAPLFPGNLPQDPICRYLNWHSFIMKDPSISTFKLTNSIFHLTFEVAQKLNVVYRLYFSEEFWMWCLIPNIWKEKIILQRTKFKSLPQDDDAKDDVASKYWPLNLWSAPIYKRPVMTPLTVG